jgi:Tfp pilus assembly protein PilF
MISSFPYIFTFYSYKGGVGRSLALVNTAYALAGRGRHVLVVDMDLEAPGISGFLRRTNELAEPEAAHPKDILDLLWECITGVKEGKKPAEIASRLPPVSTYSRPVTPKKLDALAPRLGELGRLDFLVADDSRDYWRRLADLGIQGLPQDQLIALSTTLHHYFKSQRFSHRLFGLEPFDPPTPTPYDYVLVDSRTGITEVGGLCVGPLADRLVVLTGLNDQNIHGTLSFFKEAGIDPRARMGTDQPWDKADTPGAEGAMQPNLQPSLGPKPTLIVASPVPSGEIELKQQRVSELTKLLKIEPIQLSYHPRLGLIECIFVRDYPEEQLTFNYNRLADNIMARVQDHPSQLALRSSKLWNTEKRPLDSVECALRLASHDSSLGRSLLMQFGDALQASTDEGFLLQRRLNAFLSQSPDEIRTAAINNWGAALSDQAKTKDGAEANWLFEAAGDKFAEVLRIKPDNHEALYNWGNALSARAKTKDGAEADALFEAAGQKYAEAMRIKPDNHEALNNWGAALAIQARTKHAAEADRLFKAAGQKFSEAMRIKRDSHEALNNWGNALSDHARTKHGAEADQLFEGARQKFLAAEQVQSGSSAYDLACLEALQGSAENAVSWLRRRLASGLRLSREQIAQEQDFARVRNDPTFRAFVQSLTE